MDEYIGIVKPFAGNFAPVGWMVCDGSGISVSQYQTLYAIIGTTFGGDGVNTFNLPDLRGVVPIGAGTSSQGTSYQLGQKGGNEKVTLTMANLPPHTHALTGTVQLLANADSASSADPTGAYPAPYASNLYASTGDAPMGAVKNTLATTAQGAGQAMDNLNPYCAITYVICVEGIFPPRN